MPNVRRLRGREGSGSLPRQTCKLVDVKVAGTRVQVFSKKEARPAHGLTMFRVVDRKVRSGLFKATTQEIADELWLKR